MTSQELLKPRYEVIADYPGNKAHIGSILESSDNNLINRLVFKVYVESERWLREDEINKYPHLFRSLQWWEHRKPEDMPEYVKGLNVVKKVNTIEDHGGDYPSILCEGETIWGTIWMYEPATLEEYNSYLKSKQ